MAVVISQSQNREKIMLFTVLPSTVNIFEQNGTLHLDCVHIAKNDHIILST